MSHRLDEVDEKIIAMLKNNARLSFIEIGRALNLSEGAVRRRVKRLVDLGVIKRFTVEIEKGEAVRALTLISVEANTPTPEIAEKLASVKGVDTVYEVTGEYDAVALISVPGMLELNKCIEEIRGTEGVKATNTVIILRQISGY